MTEADGVKAELEALAQELDEILALYRAAMQRTSDLRFKTLLLDVNHANEHSLTIQRAADVANDFAISTVEVLKTGKEEITDWINRL
jgi:hypothetical protein